MQTKLIIKDEVNVKFEGLDLTTRRTLVNKFKFMLPYARYLPAVRLGRWDGCTNFFTLGGGTYLKLLDEIIPMLDERGYDIEVEDHRHGWQLEFDAVDENSVNYALWPKGHPQAGQPVLLRDYQVEAINSFLAEPQSIQELSTGSGKTIMTATLCQRAEKYGRTITIVPNKDLVRQTEADYRLIGLDVGVYFGDRKEYGKTHTICTWQSLNILGKRSKSGEAVVDWADFVEGVNCVIVDEAHMSKADVLKELLSGPFSQVPIRWGMTGTIPKEEVEWRSLQVSLGPVVNRIRASDLQEQGVLANCNVNIVQVQDGKEFANYQAELKYLLTDSDRLDFMAKLISKAAEEGNTLVLVDRIEAGKELVNRLPGSVFISGEVKSDVRKEHYDEVSGAEGKIIVATYGVAAVGINIPRIFNLVLVEPGKSFVRVIQSIGRGIRKAEDKDNVQIWDITSSCKFAKRHLTKRKQFYNDARYPWAVEKVSI
jgi:superfamily II DNA or RNA helicase